jgi:flagellar protein FlaG
MDVTGPRPTEAHPPTPQVPPAPGARPDGPVERVGPPGPAGLRTIGDRPESMPPLSLTEAPWVPRSTLKMGLTAADVNVRFEIDKDSSRVTVTMYDRASGEVLRQIPPKEVQDIIESLAGRGLIVDDAR